MHPEMQAIYGYPAPKHFEPEDPAVTEARMRMQRQAIADKAVRLADLVSRLPALLLESAGPPVKAPDGSRGWYLTYFVQNVPAPFREGTASQVDFLWVTTDGQLLCDRPGPYAQRHINLSRLESGDPPVKTRMDRQIAAERRKSLKSAAKADRRSKRHAGLSTKTTTVLGPPFDPTTGVYYERIARAVKLT